MYRLPPVVEFSGLLEVEYAALAALPWQEVHRAENDSLDMAYLCIKGRVRYGKTIVTAGQLAGVLPFVVNSRLPVEFLSGAACLALATEELARFFLKYPAALRAFTGTLRQSGRELLSCYENHPAVIVIEPELRSLELGEFHNTAHFSLPPQAADSDEQLRLAWAQFYHESLIRKVKVITVEADHSTIHFFRAEASIMILREQLSESLPESPAILLLVSEKNKTGLKRVTETLFAACNGTAAIRFLCDTGDHIAALSREGHKKNLTLFQGASSFLAAAEGIGKKVDREQTGKFLFSLLQPIYPRASFFEKKYAEKKIRKFLADRDLVEVGIVTAGRSWRAAGNLALALADSIYPPGTNEQMPENILRREYAFFRMLRLGIRQGTYEKAGTQILLSADMRALSHDIYPEKSGRRGIEFQWHAY